MGFEHDYDDIKSPSVLKNRGRTKDLDLVLDKAISYTGYTLDVFKYRLDAIANFSLYGFIKSILNYKKLVGGYKNNFKQKIKDIKLKLRILINSIRGKIYGI